VGVSSDNQVKVFNLFRHFKVLFVTGMAQGYQDVNVLGLAKTIIQCQRPTDPFSSFLVPYLEPLSFFSYRLDFVCEFHGVSGVGHVDRERGHVPNDANFGPVGKFLHRRFFYNSIHKIVSKNKNEDFEECNILSKARKNKSFVQHKYLNKGG